jgi:signal peptidase I
MDEGPVGELDGRLSAEQIRNEQAAQAAAASSQGDKTGDADGDDAQSALKEWIELLVRAGTWALLIYILIFQISVVDGDSMNPTFHQNDRLVIDKLTYRFSDPKRFDVIVFEAIDVDGHPRMPKDYIKRVIGLPGETIEIHGRSVWLDGKKIGEEYGPTYPNTRQDPHERATFVVPPHHYLVMGDNRPFSKDSRVEDSRMGRRQSLGFVSVRQIRGIVRLRFWPWKDWTWFSRKD